jgi:hypothetical protein
MSLQRSIRTLRGECRQESLWLKPWREVEDRADRRRARQPMKGLEEATVR